MTDDVTGARKGDYLILGTLGAGGMGKVYKVRNTLSDRVEAMKVLLPDLSEQQELADRFLREIKVLGSLHHPNIAELRTALTIGNQLVMIMEYVEGTTLASRLQQGDMRYADALACFDQVLAALSCAHSQRVVHRDIKPANIMLAPYGIVKLMDFGIARSGNDMGLTMTGTTLGSVAYMSPEQVRCEPLDGRSDLYSVGVSLYETITGQRPYVSDNNFEVMQAHLQVPPTPPIDLKADIPPGLNQLILMAMAKNPAQRFQTADAMRGALRSVAPVLGEPTPFAPEIPESTLDMPAQQTPYPARPSTPRSVTARPVAQQPITARPVTARPVTARPVTARPVTAQPAAAPSFAPASSSGPLEPTIPLSGSAHQYPQPEVPAAAVAVAAVPAQAQPSAGNRRGLYIALSAVALLVVLAAAGFGAKRWMDSRPSENSATTAADNPTPVAPPPGADVPATPVTPAMQSVPAVDPPPSKPAVYASAKPRATVPAAAQNSSQLPPQQVVQQPAAPPPSAPQPPPAVQQPSATQPDHRAAEQSARKTVASIAQLAALEHEEFDELEARANKVNARVAALPQQPGAEVAASQQRARNELALAQSALQRGDVQNAQKLMEQAEADISKVEKLIGN
jgi:eukaryotic-like serine/threonine-protein kinase